ncbi:MAG: hypothetical protein KF905_09360 [Flavobacteriales bacterium]|nr:hypothetical protein [Flavobacteriales bacterium]
MMRRTVLLPLLAALGLQAQDPQPGIAYGGAQGIFIIAGDGIPQVNGKVQGYRIERRAQANDAFKQVAELKPVGSAKELTKHLERAGKVLPYPIHALAMNADSLWAMVSKGERRHLGALFNDVPTMMACQLAWHDADAKNGERYQYRITPIDGAARVSQWTTAGQGVAPVAVAPVTGTYWEKERRMELHYRAAGAPRASEFRLWRSDDGAAFEEVNWMGQARLSGDTAFLVFTDTTAARYRPLRYVLKAWDPFGHAAPRTDTLYTASLDATQMPMPTDVVAAGDSSGRSIGIRWRLPNAPLVKQLTLYRSTNSEDGFEPIAALPSDRTEFIDERIRPATSYFYFFQLEYKATHIPMRAPLFAASVYDPTPPDAPEELEIESIDGTVSLTWTYLAPNAHGFLVFRGENGGELKQVSTLVEGRARPDRYQWTDNGSGMRGGNTYRYAIHTMSSSHIHGAFSDTVAIVPALPPAAPPVPKDLEVLVDAGNLQVVWEDLSNEPFLLGYQLLRTRKPQRGAPVTDTLFLTVNHYMDTVHHAGTTHSYRVRSLSQLGPRSAFSNEVGGSGRFAAVPPPSGLNARRSNAGVELSWSAALRDDIVRYDVYRYTRGQDPVKVSSVSARQALALRDDKVPGGLLFYFVRAVDADGNESAASSEVVVE